MLKKVQACAFVLTLLTGCGGSDSSGGNGRLSVSVTDTPIDSAVSVVLAFSGVSVKPADGDAILTSRPAKAR
jgi:hypothetical protein